MAVLVTECLRFTGDEEFRNLAISRAGGQHGYDIVDVCRDASRGPRGRYR
jgi:hypothetical protein